MQRVTHSLDMNSANAQEQLRDCCGWGSQQWLTWAFSWDLDFWSLWVPRLQPGWWLCQWMRCVAAALMASSVVHLLLVLWVVGGLLADVVTRLLVAFVVALMAWAVDASEGGCVAPAALSGGLFA